MFLTVITFQVYDEQTKITRRQEAISKELEAVGEDMDRMQVCDLRLWFVVVNDGR